MTYPRIFKRFGSYFFITALLYLSNSYNSFGQVNSGSFITLGGFVSGSKFHTDSIKKESGLIIPAEWKCQKISYTVTMDDGPDRIVTMQGFSPQFSPQLKQFIATYARSGTLMTMDNIRVKLEDGRERVVPSLIYYIY